MDADKIISTMAAQGMTAYSIARALNAKGVPTPTGKGQWHHHTVERHMSVEARQRWADYMKHYRQNRYGSNS